MDDHQSNSPRFFIQVKRSDGPVVPQANNDDFFEATEERLHHVADLIRKGCSGVAAKLFEIDNPPAEIGMEFGIDIGGEAGIPFVTKGTINANFKVSVVWQNSKTVKS